MFFPYGHSTEPQTSNLSQSPSFAGRTLHESCSREQRREASGRSSKPADSIGRRGLNLTQTQRGGGAERGARVDWWHSPLISLGHPDSPAAPGPLPPPKTTASTQATGTSAHASCVHARACPIGYRLRSTCVRSTIASPQADAGAGQARRASRTRHWPCPSPQ